LAGQLDAYARPHGGHTGISAGLVRSVCGQGKDLRKMAAQRVVHRQAAFGAPDSDVHLQRGHELPSRDGSVLLADGVIAWV
jgi:hypothetical protein